MSSYTLLARLNNIEDATDDLDDTIKSLQQQKQTVLTSVGDASSQPVLVGTTVRSIGGKDETVNIESLNNVIKVGVNLDQIQEKIEVVGDQANRAALMDSNNKLRAISNDVGITRSLDAANGIITIGFDASKIQEKIEVVGDQVDRTALMDSSRKLRAVSTSGGITRGVNSDGVINIGLDMSNIQSKLTAIGNGVNSIPLLSSSTVKGIQTDFPLSVNDNATTNILTLGLESDFVEVAAPISKTITDNNTIRLGLDTNVGINGNLSVNTISPKTGNETTMDGNLLIPDGKTLRVNQIDKASGSSVAFATSVTAPSMNTSQITPVTGQSLILQGDTVVQGDLAVQSNKKLYAREIEGVNETGVLISGNLEIAGDLLVNQAGDTNKALIVSNIKPLNMVQLTVEGDLAVKTGHELYTDKIRKTGGANALPAVTIDDDLIVTGAISCSSFTTNELPETVMSRNLMQQLTSGEEAMGLKLPFAAAPTSTMETKIVDLKAPLQIQKSTDSTYAVSFTDTGPVFTGELKVDSVSSNSTGLVTINDTLMVKENVAVDGNMLMGGQLWAMDLVISNNASVTGGLTVGGVNVLTAIASKADQNETYTKTEVNTTFANLIDSAPTALNTLKELASALGNDANYAATVQTQLANKAPLANPVFTGTVSGITKAMVGLANVDDTSDTSKPVSSATLSALNAKQDTLTAGAGASEAVLVSGKIKGLSSTQNVSLSSTADVITITGPDLTGYAATTAVNAKQDALTAGAGANQAILASNKVKGLTSTQNVSLSSTADVITITGPNLSGYATTTAVNAKQDTLTAGAGASQAILASNKVKGLTSTQNVSLSSTADVITITGPNLSGYATTTAVNAKQDTLTAGVGASQAVLASNKVKGLTGTQNVSLSSTADVITITGPDLTGYATTTALNAKQNTLTAGVGATQSILVSDKIKGLRAIQNVQVSSDDDVITITGPYLGGYVMIHEMDNKQDNLLNGPGGQPIFALPSTIKSLKSSGHVSLSSDAYSITINNNTTNPQFATSLQAPTVYANELWTIADGMVYPILQIQQSTQVNGILDVQQDCVVNGNLTANNFNPWWVAGKIDGTSATPTIVTRKGEKALEITCVRKTGQSIGVYDIRWTTPHPDGANWVGFVQGEGSSWSETIGNSSAGYTNISTGFTAVFRKLYSQPAGANEGLVDCPFTFYVMK